VDHGQGIVDLARCRRAAQQGRRAGMGHVEGPPSWAVMGVTCMGH
jgi:hypothetical protein